MDAIEEEEEHFQNWCVQTSKNDQPMTSTTMSRLLTFAVLFIATYQIADTSVVTSSEKLRDFAAAMDTLLGEAIEKAIEAEPDKREELTRLVMFCCLP